MRIFIFITLLTGIAFSMLVSCNNSSQKPVTDTVDAQKAVKKSTTSSRIIDISKSSILWHGSDPVKVHTGLIQISSGELNLDTQGKVSSGNLEVAMNSISVTDQTPEEKKPNLIKHLKSDDFFAVDSFPYSTFEITSVAIKEADKYLIGGNLTIRGKTLGIMIPVTITESDGILNLKAGFSFDRTKWGVNYHSKSLDAKIKDKAIDDSIELEINLFTQK